MPSPEPDGRMIGLSGQPIATRAGGVPVANMINLKRGSRALKVHRLFSPVASSPSTRRPVSSGQDLWRIGKAQGRSRSALDTSIAATAEANECIVVTDNERDFIGVETFNPLQNAAR